MTTAGRTGMTAAAAALAAAMFFGTAGAAYADEQIPEEIMAVQEDFSESGTEAGEPVSDEAGEVNDTRTDSPQTEAETAAEPAYPEAVQEETEADPGSGSGESEKEPEAGTEDAAEVRSEPDAEGNETEDEKPGEQETGTGTGETQEEDPDPEKKTCRITWQDWDETVLAVTEAEEGEVPVYPYDLPVLVYDSEELGPYPLDHWEWNPGPARSDACYTAYYTEESRKPYYRITFLHDGSVFDEYWGRYRDDIVYHGPAEITSRGKQMKLIDIVPLPYVVWRDQEFQLLFAEKPSPAENTQTSYTVSASPSGNLKAVPPRTGDTGTAAAYALIFSAASAGALFLIRLKKRLLSI